MRKTLGLQLKAEHDVAPRSYWRFENASDPWTDMQGVWPIGGAEIHRPKGRQNTTHWREQADGGVVGAYVDFGFLDPAKLTDPSRDWWEGNVGCTPFPCNDSAKAVDGFTVELLIRPGPWLMRGGGIHLFGELSYSEMPAISLSSAAISFTAATRPPSSGIPPPARPTAVEAWDEWSVPLIGDGVLAPDHLQDGRWHHLAFVKSAATGEASIWIDGQRPPAFHRPANASLSGRKFQNEGALSIDRVGQSWNCSLDEMAVYETALPDAVVYAHYEDAMVHHRPYTMSSASLPPPPAPSPVRPADRTKLTAADYDLLEFAPGTVLPTPRGNATAGATISAIDQLRHFARARFDSRAVADHGMMRNFNWMDASYMGGQGQPTVNRADVAPNSAALQIELATHWNFGIALNPGGSRDTGGVVAAMADSHPDWTLDATIIRQQTPGKSQISNRTLPNGCYLQNAQGELILATGAVLPAGSPGQLRVTTAELADAVGCPDSLFVLDAAKAVAELSPTYENCSTCAVSRLNEDGEYLSEISKGNLSADPKVLAAFEKSGAGTWQEFHGQWRVRLTAQYRDAIFKGVPAMRKQAKYSEYQVQGTNVYFGNWSVVRAINTIGRGTMHYSTADFYVPHPSLWYSGAGPWHGLNWLEETRRSEIAAGDTLFSPFVAAGWSIAEEDNVRPAQWLGLLKLLGVWGAEFYYAGFFSLSSPFPIPANWVWQAAIPGYAQAITSQYADLFFDSEVLRGDLYSAWTLEPSAGPLLGYSLWAGAPNRIAMARKHASKPVFVVTVSIQRYSNVKNSSMETANVTIRIPGTTIDLQVEARRQGSTYVLDDTTGTSPKLIQLDGWHEATHPYHWNRHLIIEAEMFTGFLKGGQLNSAIGTDRSADAAGVYSFLGSTSFARMPCHANSAGRRFEYSVGRPARLREPHVLWVRVRAEQTARLRVYQQNCDDAVTAVEVLQGSGWVWLQLMSGLVVREEEHDGIAELAVALECLGEEGSAIDVDQVAFVPLDDGEPAHQLRRKTVKKLKHDDYQPGVSTSGVTLSNDGFFLRNGSFFYPIGVNYWPSSTGCNLWTAKTFPSAEIQHDLDVLATSPFNSMRVFLEWGALEPTEGSYDEAKFENLAKMLAWIKQRGLLVDISTFVGWMSGRHYWPAWKKDRNLYTDTTMIKRSVAFAAKVAKTAAPFKSNLLAMEYGNEMNCCTDAAPNNAIIAWTHQIYDAFKDNAGSSVLVVPGTDENTIIGSSTWPLGTSCCSCLCCQQTRAPTVLVLVLIFSSCCPSGGITGRIAGDVLNFHPYPVLFTPTKGDGFFDAVTQAGPTYDGSFVRAFGPSFMQEWGTLVTGGVRQQDAYLRKVLPESLGNGVCGWLYWCMRDIDGNKSAPYNTTGLETALGLFGADDKIKPGLTYYADFAREVAKMTAANNDKTLPEDDPDAVGLYVPLHYYEDGDTANPGNKPAEQSGHATLAYTLLRSLGESTRVVRGDKLVPTGRELKVLVVTSSNLVASEINSLDAYVKSGGKLIWHGLSTSYFTGDAKAAAESLVGANFASSLKVAPLQVTFGGKAWHLPPNAYLQSNMSSAPLLGELRPATQAWYSSGATRAPMLLLSRRPTGGGAVLASVAAVDAITLRLMGQTAPRDVWAGWFRRALLCVRSGCATESELASAGMGAKGITTAPRADSAEAEPAGAWSHDQPHDQPHDDAAAPALLPKDALVYGAAAPVAVAMEQLDDLGVRASSLVVPPSVLKAARGGLPPLLSPISFGNASVLLVEQTMSLPDMDIAFAWLAQSGKERCVIWSGFSTGSLNRELYTMAGVAAVDLRTALPSSFSAFGRQFNFSASVTSYNGPASTIEFSVRKPVQRPEWGVAKVVATDDRGIAMLHRHQGSGGRGGGVFVMASLSAELVAGMSATDMKAWFAGLLSLCSKQPADNDTPSTSWLLRHEEVTTPEYPRVMTDDEVTSGLVKRIPESQAVTIIAGSLTITVGQDGGVGKVEISGQDLLCGPSGQVKIMSATIGAHRANATALTLSTAGELTVSLGSVATVNALVNATDGFVVLTVVSVTGTNVSDLTFANLPIKSPMRAASAAAAYGGSSSVLLLPATLSVDVRASQHGVGCTMLSAQSYAASGLAQAVAIWAGVGGTAGLTGAIQKGEKQFKLTSPTIAGVWAKQSPALRKGYFLMSVDPTTLNQTIEFALQSGIPYITMLVGSWTSSQGHYNVSDAWGGMRGMKAAVRQIKSHGLKVGIHSLSANIATHDPYVSPVPDPRLAKQGGLTLDADIGPASTWLPLHQTPNIPNPYGALAPAGGLDVMIDSEIMTYRHANASAPFGLGGVNRGAYGTAAAGHKRGATVYYMLRSGDGFLPDPDSTLLDELAANLARSYNEIGAEMIYCDGLEHLLLTGHFSMAKFQSALFTHLRGDVLAESSAETSHTWHFNARSGQTDWAATDSRVFMDDTKAASCVSARENLQGPDMGWWGYLTFKQGSYYATTPFEIEYMASRAVAYGASPNLETRISNLIANGRTVEAFARMKPWWGLSLSDAVKTQLKEPGIDFSLTMDGTKGVITPVRVHAAHVAEPDRPDTLRWDYQQYFNSSKVRGVRIRALSSVAGKASDKDIDLLRLSDKGVVRTTKCQSAGSYVPALAADELQLPAIPKVNTTIEWALTSKGGVASLQMNYSAPSPMAVGCLRQRFLSPLDLSNNTALLVKVFGDNSGALLNIELQSGDFYREFFVAVSFKGWQEIPLGVPETANLFKHKGGNFQLPTGNNAKMAMRDFGWSSTLGINFFITGVTKANISIGNIEGRAESPATLTARATLVARGLSLAIPTGLRGGGGHSDYIECEDIANATSCLSFDADGHALDIAAADSKGAAITVAEPDGLSVEFKAASTLRPRLEVTVMERNDEKLGPFSETGVLNTTRTAARAGGTAAALAV
jgi:hypothetical protein